MSPLFSNFAQFFSSENLILPQLHCSWRGVWWTPSTGGAAPLRLCQPPPCSFCWVHGCWWASRSLSLVELWERTELAASRPPAAHATLLDRFPHSRGTNTRLFTWPSVVFCRSGELTFVQKYITAEIYQLEASCLIHIKQWNKSMIQSAPKVSLFTLEYYLVTLERFWSKTQIQCSVLMSNTDVF